MVLARSILINNKKITILLTSKISDKMTQIEPVSNILSIIGNWFLKV
ncbi:MAG TPA: hypothetical protein H9829_06025 [Candidatus Tetragenococcus pullicola]|nr:hypothetical protein [Candidatus Tetragenococcus pullicola]